MIKVFVLDNYIILDNYWIYSDYFFYLFQIKYAWF